MSKWVTLENPSQLEPTEQPEPVKLHLGCGTKYLDGYINIDSRKGVGADLVSRLEDLPNHFDKQVGLIYACHVLEHLKVDDGLYILNMCSVLLKPHGILRLAVPDMGNIVRAIANGVHLRRFRGLIWGKQDYAENQHCTGWDFETLAEDLRTCGFYDVIRWRPRVVHPTGFEDFSSARIQSEDGTFYLVSLNVQARRTPTS